MIKLTKDTAYLAGAIIGDGHLRGGMKRGGNGHPGRDFRITIGSADMEYVHYVSKLIKSIIYTKVNPGIKKRRESRKPEAYFGVGNKELFVFLNKILEIPAGPKSAIVYVPTKIKESSDEIKRYFLAGYFDTDGGFRGGALGFTSASLELMNGISSILIEFGIEFSRDKWVNKKYGRPFYGIRIRKSSIDNLLNVLPLQNQEKINRINFRFQRRACQSGQMGLA